ncbi:hypothetical protein TNCT_531041 [Trichonephila clavata]|uniref:Uncharacterized protein n=1 Tax=Trichonephila clavata TaxID=2740835 RepID=A0A8X6H8X6_TRICU|nr:hypothetical protein TNCT_531041 [Trichonephila clavata]
MPNAITQPKGCHRSDGFLSRRERRAVEAQDHFASIFPSGFSSAFKNRFHHPRISCAFWFGPTKRKTHSHRNQRLRIFFIWIMV